MYKIIWRMIPSLDKCGALRCQVLQPSLPTWPTGSEGRQLSILVSPVDMLARLCDDSIGPTMNDTKVEVCTAAWFYLINCLFTNADSEICENHRRNEHLKNVQISEQTSAYFYFYLTCTHLHTVSHCFFFRPLLLMCPFGMSVFSTKMFHWPFSLAKVLVTKKAQVTHL